MQSVLPVYTPALNKHSGFERENAVRRYFSGGFTNAEITGFLALQHGIVLSVRTLKRILQRLGLTRARYNNESPLERIVAAILEELENSCGSFLGYYYSASSTDEALKAKVQFTSKKRYCYEIPSGFRP